MPDSKPFKTLNSSLINGEERRNNQERDQHAQVASDWLRLSLCQLIVTYFLARSDCPNVFCGSMTVFITHYELKCGIVGLRYAEQLDSILCKAQATLTIG